MLSSESYPVGKNLYLEWYESGKVERETYYIDGKLHRIDDPAQISYYESGQIKEMMYL